MLELIKKAIANRKRLNRDNKSYYRCEQFIKNIEYALANGSSIWTFVEYQEDKLRELMTDNFINDFETLKDERN